MEIAHAEAVTSLSLPEPDFGKVKGALLHVENVAFRYRESRKSTVQAINLTVHPGDRVALIGPNGHGKVRFFLHTRLAMFHTRLSQQYLVSSSVTSNPLKGWWITTHRCVLVTTVKILLRNFTLALLMVKHVGTLWSILWRIVRRLTFLVTIRHGLF